MTLAILVTPEELHDSSAPRVGLGLVYKAPYIKMASCSEAFFYLKSASEAEVDKRITDSHLMFVWINEASKVIPLPYIQPLFLDVPTTSDVTDSNKPVSSGIQGFQTPQSHLCGGKHPQNSGCLPLPGWQNKVLPAQFEEAAVNT